MDMFQFPSNGKVLSDFGDALLQIKDPHQSFNSLQTGKSFRTPDILSSETEPHQSFNSLQTGKSFRTKNPRSHGRRYLGFNSLQTGKSFRTRNLQVVRILNCCVSIPFKRESPFGPAKLSRRLSLDQIEKFQFPSNGKVLSDADSLDVREIDVIFVSIPFKREGPFGRH